MKTALVCALLAMGVVYVALAYPLSVRPAPLCIAPPADSSPLHVIDRATDRLALNH